jgi:hypothetical protein
LSDTEFWNLIQRTSEPNGTFRSDNLVSDEAIFAQVVVLDIRSGNLHMQLLPRHRQGRLEKATFVGLQNLQRRQPITIADPAC